MNFLILIFFVKIKIENFVSYDTGVFEGSKKNNNREKGGEALEIWALKNIP